ncbi:hypothetical protein BDZ88DRAFT_36684 [Geranomyces variabilis]|nr:hypothetical protein BDZ88DRAFT_36684 [Geranomyces variabilis]KAJ3131269.1 hypothetical protein HDU90_008623 [Geranomyces variabilis]
MRSQGSHRTISPFKSANFPPEPSEGLQRHASEVPHLPALENDHLYGTAFGSNRPSAYSKTRMSAAGGRQNTTVHLPSQTSRAPSMRLRRLGTSDGPAGLSAAPMRPSVPARRATASRVSPTSASISRHEDRHTVVQDCFESPILKLEHPPPRPVHLPPIELARENSARASPASTSGGISLPALLPGIPTRAAERSPLAHVYKARSESNDTLNIGEAPVEAAAPIRRLFESERRARRGHGTYNVLL